jgi:hypothetical protein
MNEALDDLYLIWLYSQVGDVRARKTTHWELLRQMYFLPFFWLIPNDDNRAADGRDLRFEFLDEHSTDPRDVDPDWLDEHCSFLEMLIGLSRRLAFEGEGSPKTWFWHLLENLGIADYTDRSRYDRGKVESIVNEVVFRTYDRDGRGGLFPLRRARRDQREVEIWYQMNEYLIEG